MSQGVIIVHPSRRPAVGETLERVMQRVHKAYPGYVLWTLRTPTEPVLAHARQVAAEGPELGGEEPEFRLVPLLLSPGAHFQQDVAELAAAVRAAAPGLRIHVTPPLLEDDAFVEWLLERL